LVVRSIICPRGFAANRRLLHGESLRHDCLIGEAQLHTVTSPVCVDKQRAEGLRFGDRRVHALMHALCLFALAPTGFRHREFRDHVAQLQTRDPDTYSAGSMTYDLRRLRRHGLIKRVPRRHRYRITPAGAQVAMFYARLYTRALRPASSLQPSGSSRAQPTFDRLDAALANFLDEVKLAA
jgi:DNA-binding HxlR family transcriptional regulator